MGTKVPVLQNDPEEVTPLLYLPDGSRYRPTNNSAICNRKEKIVVTAPFPVCAGESPLLVETIRDPGNLQRLAFLVWENSKPTIVPQIERDGKIFVPPDPNSTSFPSLSLPSGLLPCGKPAKILADIASTTSKFVRLRDEYLRIVASIALASWFPDCFEAAPYLFVVGPVGSAKSKLLKLLWCFCRRGLIAGDLRSGSLYKLVDAWGPTLIIDEFEPGNSAASAELLRILRTGSVPGSPTYRNGQGFSTYGLKIIASRHPLADAALSSRALIVSLLPTEEDTLPLDDVAMRKIENEFQSKLCMFRLKNYVTVKNFRVPPDILQGLSGRTKQIARALAAPILGDPKRTSELLRILGAYDKDVRTERSMEPEWLVEEALFDQCHPKMVTDRDNLEIYVGATAWEINRKLEMQGEDLRLSPKKVGLVLKGLGLHTVKLSRKGRGLKLTSDLKREVHALAQLMGIDRRCVAQSWELEKGYAGPPCPLCEEFGVTGGLRLVICLPEEELRKLRRRPPLTSRPDNNKGVGPDSETGEKA